MSLLNKAARIIRTAFVMSLLAALPLASHALARPYAPALSCERLKGMIQANGAMVVSTGQFTFDRFVRDQGFCMTDEITEPAWVVSSNSAECFIGYTCGGREPSGN